MDIYWRDSYTCPSEEQYIAMIERKTGALFSLGVKLMQLFSADQRDFSFLITLLGKYFQIRDDYANLKSATVCIENFLIFFLFQKKSIPIWHV